MAVLVEAIDGSDDAGGAGEDSAPLLEGEVGGDDRGALLVATADDVVEHVGRRAVAGKISELRRGDHQHCEELGLDALRGPMVKASTTAVARAVSR
jgi:hypothetical protein